MFRVPSVPPPTLKKGDKYTPEFNDFIATCLIKDPRLRPSSVELLKHPFVKTVKKTRILAVIIERTLEYIHAGRLDMLEPSNVITIFPPFSVERTPLTCSSFLIG